MRQQVALVTGASSGIGKALASALASRGWYLVLLARREQRLRVLAGELGGESEVCDVGDRTRVEEVARAVTSRHPRISLLVNNAGVPVRSGFFGADPAAIEEAMRINYFGSVWCLRAFLPALEAAAPSDVVNVVSVAGTVALPRSGPYAATKHAQLAFSRAAAAELRPRGIRVHTILPGFVETEGFPQRDLRRTRLGRRIVIGPDRVVSAILQALDRNRAEVVVPRLYRAASLAQAVAPRLTARMLARRG